MGVRCWYDSFSVLSGRRNRAERAEEEMGWKGINLVLEFPWIWSIGFCGWGRILKDSRPCFHVHRMNPPIDSFKFCGDAAEDEDPEEGDAGLWVTPGGGEVGDLEDILGELGELAEGSALVGEGEDDANAVDEGRESAGLVDDFVWLVGGKPLELAGCGEGEEGVLGEVALVGG
ncbi:hypothetical protein ASPFODRAFT_75083 [Aspergillus luchuensis CBS 106.47]|uniref:Uncharacterized protein n=1 Tax=Aspergillus luchuensis (strain CBS 106.47) TaxID=1137211 RepID=A0A1M3T462_ASPLC|nr:hypothetical protein ASPFODRAFT_75083 [Aspergillus luchuensis CBS 106.47]